MGTAAALTEFIDYLQEQVDNGSIYVWGAQGQNYTTITENWIRAKENSTTNANRAIRFWKKQKEAGYEKKLRAFDCSGLAMYYLQNLTKAYSSDMNANSLRGKCEKLAKGSLKKGDWVFRVDSSGKAYHIGYVIDDSLNVIEAKGRDDGVVKRGINASGASYWNAFGRPAVFKAEIEKAAKESSKNTTWSVSRVLKLVSPMMRGDDVNELQIRLNDAGYSCGAADGIFGRKTEAAVKKYQKAKGLTVDGKAGKNTVTALGGEWEG